MALIYCLQGYLSPALNQLWRSPVSKRAGHPSAANSAIQLNPREAVWKVCLIFQSRDQTHVKSFILLKMLLERVYTLQKAKSLGRPPTNLDLKLHCLELLWKQWVIFVAHKFVMLCDPFWKAGAHWEAMRIMHYRASQSLKEVILLLALLDLKYLEKQLCARKQGTLWTIEVTVTSGSLVSRSLWLVSSV